MPSMLRHALVSRLARSIEVQPSNSENHQAHDAGFTAQSKRTERTLRAASRQGARSV